MPRRGPPANRPHGLSYTTEYRAWQTMRLRCTNPKNSAYPNYGGRGITVCERWMNSVEAFVADMGPKPSPRHELDRINNDGPYSPENCRWVTRKKNSRNRRSNRLLTFRGETRTLAGWCELLGLPRDTVRKRLVAGWSVDRALKTLVASRARFGSNPKNPSGNCVACGKPVGHRKKTCSEACLHSHMSSVATSQEAWKRFPANCTELVARDEARKERVA